MQKFLITNKLIYHGTETDQEEILTCQEGDQLARANNFIYVEYLVNKYPDSIITVNQGLQIKSVTPITTTLTPPQPPLPSAWEEF